MTEPSDPLDALRDPYQPADPDPRFADALRLSLRRAILDTVADGGDMTTTETPARADYHSLGTYLAVSDARRALDFYERAFGATRRAEPIVLDDGRIGHAELAIGDSVLMLAEEFPEIGHVEGSGGGAAIRVEVPDADTAVARAVELGATVQHEVTSDEHGRKGTIVDPFHQRWLVVQAPRRSSAGVAEPRHGNAGYFTFTVPDDEAAKAFYGAVLGWQFGAGFVDRAWRIEGSGLPDAGLWGGQPYPGWKMMYAVDDLDAAVERVGAQGGRVREVGQQPYGRTADCVDNQGVEFWLWQQ
ncbi:VOC family protein [Amycolatopsis cihanbeyliensis]|uniref:Putative glyoxalase superfamily protein PhnB n=1 Tax=Amycolatopsis cihanbeyliensis TaxID=1128664 RepID=A0A542DLP8_AMYCI|nr:VOC family protein [Amycolatopsis cihanbeyliensis]TQJ04009.1 putative glyoxalase superfamily protein PhnB [Amycolatopsis cihanbeyliensis]